MFDITAHVSFDNRGRAQCPSCLLAGKNAKNLSLIPGSDGAYKCHRGCTPAEIREAIGQPTGGDRPAAAPKIVPTNKSLHPSSAVAKWHEDLMGPGRAAEQARQWLDDRGIAPEALKRYRLGLRRRRPMGGEGEAMLYAITIPIPATGDGSQWYRKERIAPWDANYEGSKWSQYGVPPQVWFTHKPATATETWLVAGEWDAILLGSLLWMSGEQAIAVATSTCGETAVPPAAELDRLPGEVKIFYDLDAPGQAGAAKVAQALGDRAKVATVPAPANAAEGWDITDLLISGGSIADLRAAAAKATPPAPPAADGDTHHHKKPLKARIVWNDDLIAKAPDSVDYLVPELLTSNELFLLAAAPRAGKSLLCLSLAHAVATGGKFLGRAVTQGTVIYVNLEDSDSKIKIRQQLQGWGEGLPVAWLDDFKLSEFGDLIELAKDLNPVLIILDTLSRIRDGNVNESSAEMSQVLEPLQQFARDQGCCVMVVHHARKVTADSIEMTDPFDVVRGNSAIRATARGCWVLAPSKDDRGTIRLFIEHGHGKHDLQLMLNANTVTWTAMGKWSPNADRSQADRILAYIQQHGEATCKQIAAAMGLPERSCQTVLWRLQNDEMIGKRGGKRGAPAVFFRSDALLVNTLTNNCPIVDESNPDPASDTAYSSTKNHFDNQENLITRSASPIATPDHTPHPPCVEQSLEGVQTLTPQGIHFPNNSSIIGQQLTNRDHATAQNDANSLAADHADRDHDRPDHDQESSISDQEAIGAIALPEYRFVLKRNGLYWTGTEWTSVAWDAKTYNAKGARPAAWQLRKPGQVIDVVELPESSPPPAPPAPPAEEWITIADGGKFDGRAAKVENRRRGFVRAYLPGGGSVNLRAGQWREGLPV